jgi:serine/threonine protein kinase
MPEPVSTAAPGDTRKLAWWERLERAWRGWREDQPPPDWRAFLPAANDSCDADRIQYLLQMDIEHRVKAGLPALLAEPYFSDPRVRQLPAQLSADQQAELIRWEYQQRWKTGQRARRSDYAAALPQHAEFVSELRPRWNCPDCKLAGILVVGEDAETLTCPRCGGSHAAVAIFRPRPAPVPPPRGASPTLHDYPGPSVPDADPMRPADVPQLPAYEILEPLGRGGMGIVFKARQVSLNRLVAIKWIRSGDADEQDQARFRAEAAAAAQLQHPAIVQVFEVGECAGRPYFTQEYVEGGSLGGFLDGAPQPPRRAARMVQAIAAGVQYAHQHGILHRDLKPANILLAPRAGGSGSTLPEGQPSDLDNLPWAPKIADFGLAKRLAADSKQTQTGAIIGTPSYMAPEQAAARKDIGPAVDVYALGAILYEMLTGRPPFRAETAWDTIQQVLQEEPVPPSRLQPKTPRDLETVCLKCLEKDPERRYASAAALGEDLGRFLRNEPIRARPVRTPERLWRWAKRNPRDAGWIAASLLLLLGGLIAALSLWGLAEARREESEEAGRRLKKEKDAADEFARLAEQRRIAADDASWQAQREKYAADDSSRLGRAAVRESLFLWVHHPSLRVDGMRKTRKLVMETAINFYQDFIRQRGNDTALLAEVADAHSLMGLAREEINTLNEALEAYETARALYVRVLQNLPAGGWALGRRSSAEAQHTFALKNLAKIHVDTGRFDAAKKLLEQALPVLQQRFDEKPSDPRRRGDLAGAWFDIGRMYGIAKQHAPALLWHKRCRDLLLPHVQSNPSDREMRTLAACLAFIGQLRWDQHDKRLASGVLEEAEFALRDAADLRQMLLAEYRSAYERKELATIWGSLGLVRAAKWDWDGSLELHQRAAALRELNVKADPDVHQHLIDLAISYGYIAEEWERRKQPATALAYRGKAIDLCQLAVDANPQSVEYLRRLGACHYAMYDAYRARKDEEAARTHIRQSIPAWERVALLAPKNIENHVNYADARKAEAILDLNAGWYQLALARYVPLRTYLMMRVTHPRRHPDGWRSATIITNNIVFIKQQLGDMEGAMETCLDLLRMRKEAVEALPQAALFKEDLNRSRSYAGAVAQTYTDRVVLPKPPTSPADARVAATRAKALLEQAVRTHPDIPAFAQQLARVEAFLKETTP